MKKRVIMCVMLLLMISISVLAEDSEGFVVFVLGNLDEVKSAIEGGINVNERDKSGSTPIMWAALYNSDPNVILYLLDQGANLFIKNNDGDTALDYIKENDKLINTEAYARIVKEVTGETVEIKTNKTNENSKKAYRNFEFGDSEEVIKSKAKEDEKIDDSYGMYYTNIAGKRFYLSFDYFDDQMYKVNFGGPDYTANYFDTTLKKERDKLVEIISAQYGDPSWSRKVNFFDISSGYINWSHVWELGDKKINIGFSEYQYEYSTKMWIQYLPLLEEKEAIEKAEEEKNTAGSVGDF